MIIKGTWAGKKHLPKLASGQDTGVDFFLFLLWQKYWGFPTTEALNSLFSNFSQSRYTWERRTFLQAAQVVCWSERSSATYWISNLISCNTLDVSFGRGPPNIDRVCSYLIWGLAETWGVTAVTPKYDLYFSNCLDTWVGCAHYQQS